MRVCRKGLRSTSHSSIQEDCCNQKTSWRTKSFDPQPRPITSQSLDHSSLHCNPPNPSTSCPSWISHRSRPHRQVITGRVRPHRLPPSAFLPRTPYQHLPRPNPTSSDRPVTIGITISTWLLPPYATSPRWLPQWNRQGRARVSLLEDQLHRTCQTSNSLHPLQSRRSS